jgi:Zn-dependent protease
VILALFISIDVHEFAHAWAATQLGDYTARSQGRLTLNPMVHLEPLGTMMIICSTLSGFGIGWGKPVPVNGWNLRYGPQVGMGIVSAAGPLSNIILATLLAIPIRLGTPLPGVLWQVLLIFITINIVLAVFNLIPIYPLDGHSILMGILSTIRKPWAYQWGGILSKMEQQGPFLFLLLIMASWVLPVNLLWLIMGPPVTLLQRVILGV